MFDEWQTQDCEDFIIVLQTRRIRPLPTLNQRHWTTASATEPPPALPNHHQRYQTSATEPPPALPNQRHQTTASATKPAPPNHRQRYKTSASEPPPALPNQRHQTTASATKPAPAKTKPALPNQRRQGNVTMRDAVRRVCLDLWPVHHGWTCQSCHHEEGPSTSPYVWESGVFVVTFR